MPWYAWALIVVTVLGMFEAIGGVGQHRGPRTPGEATLRLLLSGLTIWAIVALAGAR
jgi:hypothetical protein